MSLYDTDYKVAFIANLLHSLVYIAVDTSVSFVRWQRVNIPQAWVGVVFCSPMASQFDVYSQSAFQCNYEKVDEDVPLKPFSPFARVAMCDAHDRFSVTSVQCVHFVARKLDRKRVHCRRGKYLSFVVNFQNDTLPQTHLFELNSRNAAQGGTQTNRGWCIAE